jgi:hypothetical protein
MPRLPITRAGSVHIIEQPIGIQAAIVACRTADQRRSLTVASTGGPRPWAKRNARKQPRRADMGWNGFRKARPTSPGGGAFARPRFRKEAGGNSPLPMPLSQIAVRSSFRREAPVTQGNPVVELRRALPACTTPQGRRLCLRRGQARRASRLLEAGRPCPHRGRIEGRTGRPDLDIPRARLLAEGRPARAMASGGLCRGHVGEPGRSRRTSGGACGPIVADSDHHG